MGVLWCGMARCTSQGLWLEALGEAQTQGTYGCSRMFARRVAIWVCAEALGHHHLRGSMCTMSLGVSTASSCGREVVESQRLSLGLPQKRSVGGRTRC